jgi:DNA-binding CsgD family transcriptional regulator
MNSRAEGAGGATLVDRTEERAALEGVLGLARAGASSVLTMVGEPGVGKTALLEYAVQAASGFRVARASGVESEMELAFAGLQQLCSPLLAGLARLPGAQRTAVETAFGLSAGTGVPPDPLFVGLGVLGLLSEAASARPLVCVVDDVQWLDRASALALGVAVRRLEADAVAVLLVGRELGDLAGLPGAVRLQLAGLPDADARALLASAMPGWVTGPVMDQIVAATGGNPLALIELPRAMTPAELAGGLGFLGTSGLPGRVEESFRRRLGPLPEATRHLVLLAAADPSGDAALLWRACGLAGIEAGAAGPAEDAGLLQVGTRVRFFHPLVRSAAYRAASADERLAAHGILAAATDAALDPDRHAWHRAQASPGPDEEIAAELERSAERALARGGAAAAAVFGDRSVALTLGPARRSVRALAAAQAWYRAGGYDKALELLEIAEAGPLDELPQAQAERLRAQIISTRTDGRDGLVQLLQAAQRLEQSDRELAQVTYAQALGLSMGSNPGPDVGRAFRDLPLSAPPSGTELLLHGYGVFFTEGFPHGIDAMTRAVDMLLSTPVGGELGIWVLGVAAQVAMNLWDAAGAETLSSRLTELVRDMGAVGFLPAALDRRAYCCVFAGDLAGCAAAMGEAAAIRQATGRQPGFYDTGLLSALRDEESTVTGHIEQLRHEFADIVWESPLEHSLAVLYIGLARYPEALAAARRSVERHHRGGSGLIFADLVEAAARSHEIEVAQAALDALTVRTRIGGKDWGLGVEACARALLAEGSAAEDLYREAIERLARTPMRLPLARAHLVYGEWLRRERRRGEARDQLRLAYDVFEAIGARSFAQRARQELTATGVTVHSSKNMTLDELTPQEARIAGLAADGLSNAEIGARLYISANTVDYHLRKVFRKLSISSRAQLHRALAPGPPHS